MPRFARNDLKGFTLLEILLVTVVLGILLGIVTPRFRHSFDALQLKNFVLDASALLRLAHDKAILEKETYRLRFTKDPDGCRLEKGPEFRPIKDRSGLLRILPKNVRAQTDPDQIVMYPDGSATQARWDFTDPEGHAISLSVDPETGEATVEESDG